MQLTKREGLLLAAFGLLLILYLFYVQAYKPVTLKTQKLVKENQEIIKMGYRAEKADKIMVDNAESRKQAFVEFCEKVPEKAYLPETIDFLEKLSKYNKVELLMTQYILSEDLLINNIEGECQECLFEIDLTGSYLNLTKFIGGIEAAPRLYNIESITMTMEEAIEINEELGEETLVYNPQVISMKIIFKTYYDNIGWEGIKGVKAIDYNCEPSLNPFGTR